MKKLILASASPRRKQLLEQIGLDFSIDASNIDEVVDLALSPKDQVELFSQLKAQATAKKHADGIIIAADTMVVLDGIVYGKTKNKAHSAEMLRELSGKKHAIITAFTLIDASTQQTITKSTETFVWFRELKDKEIDTYIEREKPFDKAGAYGIQGLAAIFIERIEGDYSGAIGLPLFELAKELKKFSVKVL